MEERRIERRRREEAPPVRARTSPVNLLILAVIGILGVLAAATAVVGTGFDDKTPHGRVLGDLQHVADAQELHHARYGEFAAWLEALGVEPKEDVRLILTRGDSTGWEAVATHAIGLTCVQGGRVEESGRVVRDRPTCYNEAPR